MDNRKTSQLGSEKNNGEPKNPLKISPKINSQNAPKSSVEVQSQGPKIKAAAKPIAPTAKPIVEGINSPKTSNDIIAVKRPAFTDQEKQLISETDKPQVFKQPKARLMPESVVNRQGRPQTHFKAIFMTMVVLLLLVYAGYKFYVWKLEKTNSYAAQNNYSPALNNNALNNPTDVNASTSSSTLNSLAPGNSASTTSSTLDSMPFPLAGGSVPTGTPATTTPAAPVLQLKINSTPTGYLNVRSQPSTSGQILGQVHPGEIYTYTSTKPGWYFISIPNATSGWVSAQYVTLQ